MIEFKPEHTIALDEVTSAAGALKERLDVLCELSLEDEALRQAVGRARDTIAAGLETLLERRREAGELPDAGQREKAQFGAMGLRVKTLFSEDTEAHVIAGNLLEHCDDLLGKITAAQEFTGENAGVDRAVADLKSAANEARRDFADLS